MRRSSDFAQKAFAIFLTGSVVILLLDVAEQWKLIGDLTESSLRLVIWCQLLGICFLFWRRKFASRRVQIIFLFTSFFVIAGLALTVVDDLDAFDSVPLIGHDSDFKHTVSKMMAAGWTCGFLLLFYRLLSELEDVQDQLERRVAERTEALRESNCRLRKSEEKFRILFENSPDAIFVEDLHGRVLDVNAAACSLHNMNREELIGRTVLELVPPTERSAVAQDFPKLATEELNDFEGFSWTSDDHAIPVEIRHSSVDYTGTPALLLHVRDISKRKQAEEALQSTLESVERRIRERTLELSQANNKLQLEITERKRAQEQSSQHLAELAHVARVSTMGEMVAGLSHELNQPLTAMSNYANAAEQLLTTNPTNEQARELLSRITEQACRAGEIIRRLRSLTGKTQPHRSSTDIKDLIREVTALFKSQWSNMSEEVELHLDDDLPLVVVDRVQIQQVILNLLNNAWEATSDLNGRRRTITLEAMLLDDSTIEVAVIDNGEGLPWGESSRVFDAFYTTKDSGMGMGLAISRSIVEAHGGSMSVESVPHQPTRFHFTLPVERI